MTITRQYEPEIDGLRAVAVLAVIFFHAHIPGFSGGFIGVDIFFVISGYLITRNILFDIQQGEFTFTRFYSRRIRRLFPAMFFTMALTAILGIWLFAPLHLERLGGSLIYAATGLSNFYFWQESGYWDTLSDFKPLLHFWSLAVEEQFYLIWPAALLLLFKPEYPKRSFRITATVLAIAAVASLVAAQYMITRDDSAAFYLMPFRIVEFAAGALLVIIPKIPSTQNYHKEILSGLGLIAISTATILYHDKMPYPGLNALLPCLGTVAIIYAGAPRYIGLLLRNRIMVGIGLISYSLYLIHWPLFVFFRYWKLEEITPIETAELILASLIMAFLMYLFVEQPFRNAPKEKPGGHLRPHAFAGAIMIALSLLVIPVAHAWKHDGWDWRLNENVRSLSHYLSIAPDERLKNIKCLKNEQCTEQGNGKHYLLIGDSYGEDILAALHSAYPEYRFSVISQGGCIPLIHWVKMTVPVQARNCMDFYQQIYNNHATFSEYDGVILSMRWEDYMFRVLAKSIEYFKARKAKTVIVTGPRMNLLIPSTRIISKSRSVDDFITLSNRNIDWELQASLEKYVKNISNSAGARYLDVAKAQCKDDCSIVVPDQQPYPVIQDKGHWTTYGAEFIGKKIRQQNPGML